jgi:predicted Zn-dependent protease
LNSRGLGWKVSGEKKIGNKGEREGDTYFLRGMEGFIYDKSPFIPLVRGSCINANSSISSRFKFPLVIKKS